MLFFVSGHEKIPKLGGERWVFETLKVAKDWKFDVVSIGCSGPLS